MSNSRANLSGRNLREMNLSKINFEKKNLTGATLTGLDLREKNFTRAKLKNANLERANLSKSILTSTIATLAIFTEADLSEAILEHAWLQEANFTGAILISANLTDAYLYSANLTRANLTRANLTRANLTRANLSGANLTGVDLSGANLTGADLSGANLTGAILTGANLAVANLTGANFTGVNLDGLTLDIYQRQNIMSRVNQPRPSPPQPIRLEPRARAYSSHLEPDEPVFNGRGYVPRSLLACCDDSFVAARRQSGVLSSREYALGRVASARVLGHCVPCTNPEDAQWVRALGDLVHEPKQSYGRNPQPVNEIANLQNAHLEKANLRGANLQNAHLEGAHLERADLTGANLLGTNLMNANLINTNLEGADLRGADLRGATLYRVNLRGAYLEGADFTGVDLEGIILSDKQREQIATFKLARQKRNNSSASGKNLIRANLKGVNLVEADLEGVNIHGSIKTPPGASLPGGGLQSKSRFFKLVSVNGKEVDGGRYELSATTKSGKAQTRGPKDKASTAFSEICKKKNKKDECTYKFAIQETTNGSNKKIYHYEGKREKLARPIILELKDNKNGEVKEVVKKYKNIIVAL